METYRNPIDTVTILSDGIERLSTLETENEVLHHAHNISLALLEGSAPRAYLSLLSQYVSILLSNIRLREEMRRMRGHYEDIIVKKETAEKLALLGTVAAGLAHEIKNPLVSIKTLAQLLPERFDDPEFRNHFTTIAISEVDRIGGIVSDLLDFAKSSEPKFEPLDVSKIMKEITVLLSSRLTKSGIVVRKNLAGQLPMINGDRSQLKQVFLNIFLNSIEAMPHGGEITVDVTTGEYNEGAAHAESRRRGDAEVEVTTGEHNNGAEKVVIKITDTGSGIQEENMIHLFEPFFTTKGSGTGLGLSICKRIVEKHSGEISVESVYNKGTTVTLVLPESK